MTAGSVVDRLGVQLQRARDCGFCGCVEHVTAHVTQSTALEGRARLSCCWRFGTERTGQEGKEETAQIGNGRLVERLRIVSRRVPDVCPRWQPVSNRERAECVSSAPGNGTGMMCSIGTPRCLKGMWSSSMPPGGAGRSLRRNGWPGATKSPALVRRRSMVVSCVKRVRVDCSCMGITGRLAPSRSRSSSQRMLPRLPAVSQSSAK
jgi:hypothetical protein